MRVPLDVGPLMQVDAHEQQAILDQLVAVVAAINRHGLAVLVTLFPPSLQHELPQTYLDSIDGPKFAAYSAVVERVAAALGVTERIELPAVGIARAAAMIVTSVEGAELHLPDLIARAADFDPLTRARFLAGALVPGAWYSHAQRFRRWFCRELATLFRTVDVILAPIGPPISRSWWSAFAAFQRNCRCS